MGCVRKKVAPPASRATTSARPIARRRARGGRSAPGDGSVGGADGRAATIHGSVRGSRVTASRESSASARTVGEGGVGAGSTGRRRVGESPAVSRAAASRMSASRSMRPLFSLRRDIVVCCLRSPCVAQQEKTGHDASEACRSRTSAGQYGRAPPSVAIARPAERPRRRTLSARGAVEPGSRGDAMLRWRHERRRRDPRTRTPDPA